MKKVLITILACMMLFAFTACNNETSGPEKATASIKYVANMMGSSEATETAEGNFATADAMEDGATIDENGAIHATFKAIDNSAFTAYSAGMSGNGFYARYDLNIDPLTATADKEGTFLVYVIENGDETLWGTSNSRAKCTKLGDSEEEARAISVAYYLVEGAYYRQTNTAGDVTAPFASMIEGKDPIITITVAEDSVFPAAE